MCYISTYYILNLMAMPPLAPNRVLCRSVFVFVPSFRVGILLLFFTDFPYSIYLLPG